MAPHRFLLWLLCGFAAFATAAAPGDRPMDWQAALQSVPAFAPDRVLVRFKPGAAGCRTWLSCNNSWPIEPAACGVVRAPNQAGRIGTRHTLLSAP